MTMKDLIPWNRSREVSVRRGEEMSPFLSLHREMNRLFDDFFRGFDVSPSAPTASSIARRDGPTSR